MKIEKGETQVILYTLVHIHNVPENKQHRKEKDGAKNQILWDDRLSVMEGKAFVGFPATKDPRLLAGLEACYLISQQQNESSQAI